MIEQYTWPVVSAYMRHVQSAAAAKSRQALVDKLPAGLQKFTDYIETADGASVPIYLQVERRLEIAGAHQAGLWAATRSPIASGLPSIATFDFTGTAAVLASNLNANRAVVTAALIYCLRLLIDEEIPLNDGVLEPVDLILPECFLNPTAGEDAHCSPPVAGGNVETSQRIVDVILGAMGVAAASQGTMNNFLIGDERFGYYETICGGSGATPRAGGADAVQVHMTNTRITDPEILERRYPMRLWEFSIRRGSGGRGKHRGGDGAVRELEFLNPLTLAILSSRRGPHPPYGLAGGEPGAVGRNVWMASDGTRRELPGICTLDVQPGDRLRIETPGGGAWGRSD
jgi:5-oxoprolinase (ATP-hydrolysing)